MVVFTFCYRLLVVCLTRGEASASERRSVPKQQTGSGGYRFVGSSGLSPRKICIGYRTRLYLIRKSQVHAGQFREPYSFSPTPPASLLPSAFLQPCHFPSSARFRCLLKACPFHSATSTAHTGYSLFNAFSDHSPKASPFTSPLLAAFGWPHTFTLSRCIHLDGCMPYGFGHPRVSFNPVHIAVCIVFLRTTHLCPPVSFPSPSPWPPSLVPRTAVFITGPPRTDRD